LTSFDDPPEHTDLDGCQDEVRNLRAALETRPVIDQAKGILMGKHGCSADDAFTMLRLASMRDNRRVRDLAAGIVDSVQDDPVEAPKG